MIKISPALVTIQELESTAQATTDPPESRSWLQDADCVEHITAVLYDACINNAGAAGVASFAWAIASAAIKEHAGRSQETRENRQSQRAIDSLNSPLFSDTEGGESSHARRRTSPQRRSSFGSDSSQQTTYLEEVYNKIQNVAPNDDVISALAKISVDEMGVFLIVSDLSVNFCASSGFQTNPIRGCSTRLQLLDLVRSSLPIIDYRPEIVETVLAILLGGDDYWESLHRSVQYLSYEPAIVFLNDQQLMDRILGIALSRFPFESIPFLSLCRALVPLQYITGHENPPITTILGHLKSLTSVLLEEDATYRLTGDEDPYYIELTSPLDVLARNYVHVKENQKLLQFGQSQNGGPPVDSLFLEAGTLGRSLSNQKPLVVQWNYEYSGLRYLGLFLQIAVRERSVPSPQGVESILDISTEMIALLTSLLTAPFTSSSAQRDPAEGRLIAQSVLEEASDSLDSNKDVVSLIFDLFESELHRQFSLGSNNGSVELLVRCTQFAHALLAVFPGRVWPFLGRSGLLGLDGLESRLTAVVAAVEITSGRYEFLVSNIRLFEAAIEDAVTNVVARKAVSTSVTRFGPFSPEKSGTGITEASMKKIILQKEKIMHDVFESSRNWRFESLEERLDLNARICTIASNIIRYCLGVDDNADLTKKMTGCVSPAADYILSIFLSQDNNDIPIRPIMEMLLEATITPNNTIAMKKSQAWRRQTISVLDLCKVLVQANTYLSRPTSRLEDQLFSATPILAKVYAAHEAYRLPIIGLLDAMVRGAGAASQKPPSLLGFLGQGTAKCFLELLSSVDQPLDDDVLAAIIWRFLSAVVSQRQQWLALYLLTGNTPRQSLKDKDQPKPSARPMLKVALGRLSQLDGLSDLISNAGQSNPNRQQAHKSSIKLDVLAHMLEFVTLAADYWPWIMKEIESSKDLIKSSIQFLKSFEYPPGRKPSIEYLPLTIRVAGNLVTLMAMLVHLSREKADKSFSKELIPVLDQLLQSKASRPEYNVSLHGNMRKNFESRYSGFTPLNFKRTSLQRPPLGADYYYDIDLANKVLAYDTAWSGRDPHNFSNEFIVANRNLSLVEAQLVR